MSALKIQTVTGYDEKLVVELVELQKKAFPAHMQLAEPARYYADGLRDDNSMNIVMHDQNDKLIGHLQAFPQSSVYEELTRWDPAMQDDPERVYLDIIQVLPEQRQRSNGLRLFQAVCAEAEKRNIFKLSMHARTITGLSEYLHRIFAEIRFLRRIENWYGFGEPFDYLEATTTLRAAANSTYRQGLADLE